MLYPDLLDILGNHRNSLFILITNGTMVSDDVARKLSRLPHIIPVVSLEGGLEDTDKRRGTGTYNRIMNAFDNLKNNKILYGFSITVTSENVEQLQREDVFEEKYPYGARLGCFIEYIPTGRSPDPKLSLSHAQKVFLSTMVFKIEGKSKYLSHSFPRGRRTYGQLQGGWKGIHSY